MPEKTDHQMMLAVRDGDLDKLGHLFEKYHKQVYNFVLRQVEDPQSCEDIVQEVFFRMLKYRHTYRGDGKFKTWMYSIAHNAKIDHFKKARHRQDLTGEIDGVASTLPNPEESFERSSRHTNLHRALGRLSDEKREVLIMSRFQNLKYEEIAQILDCPVGTIKARVFRALKDLKTLLDEQ
ncbi:MAG: RNA polymerase sigma factor [Candidatus Latescibacterota bacterium]|nr:MAG: RNA polymerase sigma factor [Candidatus Latescibacterota bacterium]